MTQHNVHEWQKPHSSTTTWVKIPVFRTQQEMFKKAVKVRKKVHAGLKDLTQDPLFHSAAVVTGVRRDGGTRAHQVLVTIDVIDARHCRPKLAGGGDKRLQERENENQC